MGEWSPGTGLQSLPGTAYASRLHVLGAGLLASQDPAQILFEQRQKVLVAERPAGTLVRAEGFQLLFSDGAGHQTAPVGGHFQQWSDLHQGVITPSQVSRRAAPAITAWCLDQSGAHVVELHVPRRGQEVVFIHDERGEAALPQVPSPALPEVDPPRVPATCLADGATQALGGLRDNDQVNMIGHQAICPDHDLLCAAELRHELEVVLVVFLTEESLLSSPSFLVSITERSQPCHRQ